MEDDSRRMLSKFSPKWSAVDFIIWPAQWPSNLNSMRKFSQIFPCDASGRVSWFSLQKLATTSSATPFGFRSTFMIFESNFDFKISAREPIALYDDEIMANCFKFREDVAGYQQHARYAQLKEHLSDQNDLLLVDADGWFIQNYQLTISKQGIGDANALPMPFETFFIIL
jgi:hypothetical protein